MNFQEHNLNEYEIKGLIDEAMRKSAKVYAMENGSFVSLDDIIKVRELNSLLALIIAYSENTFMSIDRFCVRNFTPIKQKRIINRLNNHSGQIHSAIILELLKLRDGTKVSKYEIIRNIQQKYFAKEPIGTKDITETFNRILRKTMPEYFWFDKRYFRKANFDLRFIEIPKSTPYQAAKMSINHIIRV